MSNEKWGSSVVPHYSVSTYGKKKSTEEEKKSQAVTESAKNNEASWDEPVNVLGTAFEAEKTEKALPQWDTNANFGIRNSLENDFGIDGSRIGYKDGDVLLDGKFLMRADNNVDGTTYAKDYDAVAQNVNNYIKNNGLVGIRDYAASSGTAVNISWNAEEKTVSINGRTVVPTAVVDGKAYIPKSQLDAILAAERNTAGTSYGNIYNEVYDKHNAEVNRAYNDYINAKEFRYIPENDPAYQAYMKVANKAIEDEYANNVAAARFRTGGVGSTGQMLSAAAIREGAVDNMAAARAQFEQNAYQRYMDDLSLKRDRYDLSHGRMVDEYNMRSGVNAADKQDFYNAQIFDRDMQAKEISLENDKLLLGDAVRNYEISERFAYPFAKQEYTVNAYELIKQREYLKSLGLTDAEIDSVYDAYMK